MKKQLGIWTICGALMLCTTAAVMAQPQPTPQDHGHHDQNQNRHSMYDRGRSEGWYKKGGHVPTEYRGGSYVVNDWRGQHLRQPPRGYHYVRSDNGDFLLVAITTGVIASILAQH
jgi:Ni/Co efflux regulator RcnB